MDYDDLKTWSKRASDWSHAYHTTLRDRPVRPDTKPGELLARLPSSAPEQGEAMEDIFADFQELIPNAATHWQHPRFFAYFPANAAPASMLAEQLAASMATQGMLWQTSPAATELEMLTTDWLRQAMGLPDRFKGTIHEGATVATLCAILTMREKALDWQGNQSGLSGAPKLCLYVSEGAHSSIDKAARIAGIGQNGVRRLATDATQAIDEKVLEAAIAEDIAAGHVPIGVILIIGGTATGASDRIADTIAVAKAAGLPVHVDAAWAGSALICPEYRALWAGVEEADSIVLNPHKWLGAQSNCSVQFIANPSEQVAAMGLRPDFLQTPGVDEITNFNEWTVALGRPFRALKLWFVMRAYGLDGLRERIRNHVNWTAELADELRILPGVDIVTEPILALFTFALATDEATEDLLERINTDGRIYLTQTHYKGRYVIRFTAGQFECTRDDVMMARDVIAELL